VANSNLYQCGTPRPSLLFLPIPFSKTRNKTADVRDKQNRTPPSRVVGVELQQVNEKNSSKLYIFLHPTNFAEKAVTEDM